MYVNDPIGLPWEEGNTWQSVDVREAWHPIVEKLNEDLLAIDPNYKVLQVKEKFGDLRYYYTTNAGAGARLLMDNRVRRAELEAFHANV